MRNFMPYTRAKTRRRPTRWPKNWIAAEFQVGTKGSVSQLLEKCMLRNRPDGRARIPRGTKPKKGYRLLRAARAIFMPTRRPRFSYKTCRMPWPWWQGLLICDRISESRTYVKYSTSCRCRRYFAHSFSDQNARVDSDDFRLSW